jgi:small subunit ribosomal protein S6
MKPYEAGIVFRPELEGEALDQAIERTLQFIRAHGGEPGEPDRWGRRRLAYEIDHVHDGVYVFVPFEAGPNLAAELERHLRLQDDVLRYLVVAQAPEPAAQAETDDAAATPEAAGTADAVGAAPEPEAAPVEQPIAPDPGAASAG